MKKFNMKKMMNWVLATTFCICGASVFTSCTSSNDNPVDAETGASGIVMIGKHGHVEYWQQVESAFRTACEEADVEALYYTTTTENAYQEQVAAVEQLKQLTGKRLKGIVYAPAHGLNGESADAEVAAYARQRGIPVVILDTPVKAGSPLAGCPYFGTDNAASGRALAAEVKADRVAVFAMQNGAATERAEAFKAVKTGATVYPVSENANSDVEAVINDYDDFVFFNGSVLSSVLNLLKEKGKNVYTFDVYGEFLDELIAGNTHFKGIMAQNTFGMARKAVEAVMTGASEGEMIPTPYITSGNLGDDSVLPFLQYYDKTVSPQAAPQVGSYVWGSTIYNMGADGAARLAEAYEKAGIRHAILLVKGEAGTIGYFNNNLSNAPKTRTDRDILAETVSAMHERGIKVYAWLIVGSDGAWLENHPTQASYHFRRGYSDENVDLYQTDYQVYTANIMKEIDQNYDIDGFAIDMMRYTGIYWGWSDSDYQRLTAPKAEGGYGLTLDEYNELVRLMAQEYGYPTAADANGRLVYSDAAEAPAAAAGTMEAALKSGVTGVVAFAKMREKAVDDFSEMLVGVTQKPTYVASMSECTSAPLIATLAYGMTYNQAYTFSVQCPMLYSAEYDEDAAWVASNINYLKDMGYSTVLPSLQAYRNGTTETLTADISAALAAGCPGYLLFRTGTYDMARPVKKNDGTIELTYVRGTDSECGNLTVTVGGVTPTSVTMGGKLASTAYELQGQTITFSGAALEKLGDYGTITIGTTGSGKPSVSVASDARIVYNTPI